MTTGRPFQALCCDCGNLTMLKSLRQSRRGGPHATDLVLPLPIPAAHDTAAWARCVVTRWCSVCRAYTTHAYLRGEDDPHRDALEETHLRRCLQGATDDPEWPVGYCGYCMPGLLHFRELRQAEYYCGHWRGNEHWFADPPDFDPSQYDSTDEA